VLSESGGGDAHRRVRERRTGKVGTSSNALASGREEGIFLSNSDLNKLEDLLISSSACPVCTALDLERTEGEGRTRREYSALDASSKLDDFARAAFCSFFRRTLYYFTLFENSV